MTPLSLAKHRTATLCRSGGSGRRNNLLRRAALAAVVLAAGTLVTGCATPEYIQAQAACAQEWNAKIPPDYRQILVNRTRKIKVPDGTETCTTQGNKTRCKQGTRSEWIPYVEAEIVDLNKEARFARIHQCAQSNCMTTYGNPNCKT